MLFQCTSDVLASVSLIFTILKYSTCKLVSTGSRLHGDTEKDEGGTMVKEVSFPDSCASIECTGS